MRNGLKIQWGREAKGSNLSAGSSWTKSVTLNIAYINADSYNIIFSVNSGSGGQELSTRNKGAQTFDLNMYNRNSSNAIPSPAFEWLTIGH